MLREVLVGSLDFILHWPALDDDSADAVYEFLQDCMRSFESHYGTQLNAYYAEEYGNNLQGEQRGFDDNIPF